MSLGLQDINSQAGRDALNAAYGNAGVTEGTAAGTIKTVTSCPYIIGGKWQTNKTVTDSIAWGTAATSGVELGDLPDGKTGFYTVSVDSAQAIKVNGYVATDPADQAIIIKAPVAGTAFLAIIKVVNASGAVFNPGTTDLSAAGITATYWNGVMCPATETI